MRSDLERRRNELKDHGISSIKEQGLLEIRIQRGFHSPLAVVRSPWPFMIRRVPRQIRESAYKNHIPQRRERDKRARKTPLFLMKVVARSKIYR